MLPAAAAALFLFTAPAARADETGKKTMDTVRGALHADKKALVASTLQLSDAEAKAFWPIYDKYQKDLITENNKLYQGIEEYALAYNKRGGDHEKAIHHRLGGFGLRARQPARRTVGAGRAGKRSKRIRSPVKTF
jgi:hypothetical protein